MKSIYFLHGAPRSGNTIFSSLLNQNPKINVSANSLVLDIMKSAVVGKKSTMFQNFPDHISYDNVLKSIIHNYYQDWSGEIIIDRSLVGYTKNYNLVQKYLNPNFKCIVLIRDLFDIFASYLKWADKEPTSYLNDGLTTVKEKIECLMHKDGLISQSLLGSNNLYYNHHDNTIFIHYKEFAINPKKQIERVYRFLNLEYFKHDFDNVNQFKVNNIEYQDEIYGHNMHTIKSQIMYDDTEIQKYKETIPKEIYAQYHDTNIWLNGIR